MIIESPHAPVEIPKVSIYELLFGSLSTEDAARTALIEAKQAGKSATELSSAMWTSSRVPWLRVA